MKKHKPKAHEATSLQQPDIELKVDVTVPNLVAHHEEEAPASPVFPDAPRRQPDAVTQELPSQSALGLPNWFEIDSLLGEGGMAKVYKAFDSTRDAMVAIKILNHELARDPVVVERFNREARAAQRVNHANLVQVFDCGVTSANAPYLVMEYVEGTDLSRIINEEGHLSVARGVNIFVQLCGVLKKAHETGLVHRDIKPSNILIFQADNGEELVKLTDFGIAKPPSSERAMNPSLTHTGSILGSPAYMSPEQAMGQAVDERSDIYSLGCVMYETLTGRSPFAADTPVKSIVKHIEQSAEPFDIEFAHLNIPKALEDTILKCLYKKPARRFQKVYQLEDALTNVPAPGIHKRLLSHLIDSVLVLFIAGVLGQSGSWLLTELQPWLVILMTCLYYALFESSKLQATPGKLIMGFRACNSKGGRLSFFSVMACLSTIWFCLSTIVVLVSTFLFATVLVAHPVSATLTWCIFLSIWFMIINGMPSAYNHGRQDLFDMMFGRVITKPYYSREGSSKPRARVEWHYAALTILLFSLQCIFVQIELGVVKAIDATGTRSVVIARRLIPRGATITSDMVGVRHSYPNLVAPRFYADLKDVVGKKPLIDIDVDDPFSNRTFDDGQSKKN